MSRIGRKPVEIPKNVKINLEGSTVKISGPKGELSMNIHRDIKVEMKDNQIHIARSSDKKQFRALHGLTRALIQNMITGVTNGFEKKLEIVGVGYKAELRNNRLNLALGFSHPIVLVPPKGIIFETPTPTNVTIKGIDKYLVGQIAAKIRALRPPEPYKGKGIKYEGEILRRKAGKTAA